MALTREYTYWHLTPHGWVEGKSQTDSGIWQKSVPFDTVLTVKYEEVLGDDLSMTKTTERTEVKSKALIEELETKFPFKFYI